MIDAMLVNGENRYEVADWCNGQIWRDGREGLHVPTIYGVIWAKVGDIVVKTPWGFDVFVKKMQD